ncbi:YhfX family PLP-dependent enzyme [Thaumasiovibrio subtropicus]|uniref:YhfX family PLP-dependent enzyme n=1 Tax=Thaumasiovibrio subtropicus TaxID=1891207 RepID=UPI000B36179E|nr:YhfX family PLP-dependent enzyme [Thaumasiovibrio subtropicus]
MFLKALENQNPGLIDAALMLHRQAQILPDTTVIDVDQFIANARAIKASADEAGITLYAMTKQIGRNPLLAKMLVEECGYAGIVCVDFKETRLMAKAGIPIANVGHLVQPPDGMIENIVRDVKPEVMTVYSLEKAKRISDTAQRAGRVQPVLLKFYQATDHLYVNQESGFPLEQLEHVVAEIRALPGIRIHGVTHFPCFLFDTKTGTTAATPNLATLGEAKCRLEALGVHCEQVNAPSATSCEIIPMLAEMGCTHGEPGHALTGTTPANALLEQKEKIALLYLSEISHHHKQDSYCFGGGLYRRGQLEHGLLSTFEGKSRVPVLNDDPQSIDYHFRIPGHHAIGSPVIMAYRTQVFVTRSDVALVKGIASGKPTLIATFDALGNRIDDALMSKSATQSVSEVQHG